MSYVTEEQAIFGYMQTKWNTVTFGGMAYENNPYPVSDECYSEVAIIHFGASQVSLGGRTMRSRYRKWGYVQLDIFDVINKGKRRTTTICSEFCRLFQSLELVTTDQETICFLTPDVRTLGAKNDRYRTIIRCQFYRDELAVAAAP